MPTIDQQSSTVYEPVDWRGDYLCGAEYPVHAFAPKAKCTHPFKGEEYMD